MTTTTAIDPIVKKLTLNATPARAFEHFTKSIHVWWPLATLSLSQAAAKTAVFEAHAGGRIYEIDKHGREREWGRVLACEPPRRLVFSWVLEQPDNATEVEVRFEPAGKDGCAFTLIHRGWDSRPQGGEWRGEYDEGWQGVLAGYAQSLK